MPSVWSDDTSMMTPYALLLLQRIDDAGGVALAEVEPFWSTELKELLNLGYIEWVQYRLMVDAYILTDEGRKALHEQMDSGK